MRKLALPVALYATLFACTDEPSGDDPVGTDSGVDTMMETAGDTGGITMMPPEFRLTTADWQDAITTTCGDDDRLQIVLEAEGVGYDVEIWIADTYDGNPEWPPSYDEVHDMEKSDYSVEDQYSVFELDIQAATEWPNDDYDRNVATTFRCENLELPGAAVTYAVKINDQDGMVSDCIVFGDAADDVKAKTWDGLAYPSWLTDDCTAL